MPGRSSFTDQPDLFTERSSNPFSGKPASGGMSNPFQGVLTSNGPGMASSSPTGAKPYSALFDPSAGGARGVLGALFGNPTRAEHQQQVAGGARAKAFASLSEAISAGVPPQKAFLQFMETPEGQNFFATSQDPAAEIAQFMKQATPDTPSDYTLGNERRSGVDNSVIATAAPDETEAVRSFNGLAAIANLSPEQTALAAQAKLMGESNDATQREAAFRQLVDAKVMDELTAQKWLSGVISKVPLKDAIGNVIGEQVVDHSTGKIMTVGQPNTPQAMEGLDEPPFDPKATEEGAPMRRLSELGMQPADIVDSAGPLGTFAEKVGGLAGNLPGMGKFSGSEAAIKRQALSQIAADANTLLDVYSKNNRASAADTKNIQGIIGGITGMTTNPQQAANKLLVFSDYLDTREKLATQDRGDSTKSPQARGDADAELNAIRRAKSNLPPREALMAKVKQLQTAPSAVEQMLPDVKGGLGQVEKEAGYGAEEAPAERKVSPKGIALDAQGQEYTFKDRNGLRDAIAAGTVKEGDTVIFNGEPRKLERKKK